MRRAGDILKTFLDHATAEKAELYHGFFTGWAQVVGERIAAHSQIKNVDNGMVIVEVDHPGWIQMIQLKQSRFVEVLRTRYPDLGIRGLRLQLPWDGLYSSADARNAGRRREDDRPERGARGRSFEPHPASERPGDRGATDEAAESPPDPMIRGALERLGRAIEERDEP